MIARRNLLAAPLALCAPRSAGAATPPALPIPASRKIAFRILRNGTEVGLHTLRFAEADGSLAVSIEIDIAVKLGPFTVYHYSHRGIERWRDGRFVGMTSKTDDDGSDEYLKAAIQPEGMVVEGSQTQRYVAPPGVLPTTYWNRAMVQDQLINSQDGRLFEVTVADLGRETLAQPSGEMQAQHFQLTGDLPIDLWYDAQGHWVALEFAKRGSRISYQKL